MQIKEEDNPVIENHITLTNMPFNQPVPPIIIIQNDEAIAIIQKQLNRDVKRKDDPKVIAFVEEQIALIQKKKA